MGPGQTRSQALLLWLLLWLYYWLLLLQPRTPTATSPIVTELLLLLLLLHGPLPLLQGGH